MKALDDHQKAKVALSFLEELEFCYERKVFQCDQGPHNTMYDLKTGKVILVDFDGVAGSTMPEGLDINRIVLSVKDQGRIFDIFNVRFNMAGELCGDVEKTSLYFSFKKSC